MERIVALGAMTFGGQTSCEDAERMVDMFLEAGYSWLDTAFMYTDGASEKIVGEILRAGRRDKVFLATKAYPDKLGPGKPRGLTPESVREQLETSLQRMKLDNVDLFYLHAPDNKTPLEVTLTECERLRSEGKFTELGLSNYASWQIAEIIGLCKLNGWRLPIVYQGMYNPITRAVEPECIPACRHFDVRFLAYNPLAGGLLSGKYEKMEEIPSEGRFSGVYYRDRFWRKAYFDAVEELKPITEKTGIPMAEATLRWLMHHSQSDGLLIGASKIAHLKANLAACAAGPLPQEYVDAFDKAWETTRPDCPPYLRD